MIEVDIKKIIKDKKINIGTQRTIKLMKNGKVKHILLSSNCPSTVKKDFLHYSKVYDLKVTELKETNEELGSSLKKPYNISVISF